jgi:hypothetical protein
MTFNPTWHAEYLKLEQAHEAAASRLAQAARRLEYKRRPANAEAEYAAALAEARAAGDARWNFEMAACTIVRA